MTNAFSKIAKAALGLVVAAGLVASASNALALTAADISMLQAAGIISASQAAALMASVGGSTTTTGTCYQFTTNLSVGTTSEAVRQLQMVLNSNPSTALSVSAGSNGSAGHETTYFGPATASAVVKFQVMKGISPTAPQVGPMTRTALNASCTTGPVTTTPGTTTGPVMATLAVNNPASGYVTTSQAGAELLKLTFTGSGTVTNVQLKKLGIAADASYSNVYLYDGAMRLTDGGSISSNGLVTFANPSGLFTVNGSRTITVKADLAATTGEVIGLALNSYVVGGTTMTATISGNLMSVVASSGLTQVAVGASTLPSAGSIDPQNDFVVWQNTLTVTGRDAKLNSIALREVGSINYQDVNNFRLTVDGVTVATTANIDMNGYVTLVPSAPVTLMQGTRVLKVTADVVGGSNRTFSFQLRNKVDLNITDAQSGYGVSATGTFAVTAGTQTVNQGSITVQKATTSPSGDVIYNGNDVVLARYTLRSFGEAVKIDSVKVSTTQSSGTAGLRSGRLVIDGMQVGSTATIAEDSAGTPYTLFNTNYTLAAGTTATLEVRADLYDTTGGALAAATTVVTNLMVGSSNAQGVSSGQTFNFPTSTITSNTITVRSGTVTLAKNGTYTNQTTAVPQTAFKLGSWTVTGGSVEDVNLDTFSFALAFADAADVADLNNVTLKVNGVQVGSIKSTVTSPFSFSGNVTVPKNTSKTIELYADLLTTTTDGDGTPDTIIPTLTVTGTTTPSGSSVTPSATAGQTTTAGTGTFTSSVDSSAPLSRLVTASQTSVNVGAFKFSTTNDNYTVNEIAVKFSGVRNPEQTITAVRLVDSTGATIGASQALSGTTATFSGLNWVIPANTNNKYFTVFADLAAIGTSNGTSGTEINATLDSVKYTDSTGVQATDATDRSMSTDASKVYYAFKSVPVITNVNLPSTILAAGTQTIAKINIAATGGNAITWKKLKVNVAASSSVALSAFTLVDETGSTIPTSTMSLSGSTLTIVTTTEEEIATSKTYAIKATVALTTPASGDSISSSIVSGVTSYTAPAAYATVAGTAATFAWSDKSDVSHSTTTLDWNDNYLVKNIPTDSQTLTF